MAKGQQRNREIRKPKQEKAKPQPENISNDTNEIGKVCDGAGRTDGDTNSVDHHYGLRVEADRSWTVYHVFTGAPAHVRGQIMVGLDRAAATGSMLSMNLRNARRGMERIRLNAPRLDGGEIDVPE